MAQTYRETREREEDGLQFDLKAMEESSECAANEVAHRESVGIDLSASQQNEISAADDPLSFPPPSLSISSYLPHHYPL
jgi:hypothetical protein